MSFDVLALPPVDLFGQTQKSLAQAFNIAVGSVGGVVSGRAWRHVE